MADKTTKLAQAALSGTKVNDPIVIDLANAWLDKTGQLDVSDVFQKTINRALKEYPVVGDNKAKNTFVTIEVLIPPGRYLINKTITVDCYLGGNDYSSDIITCAIKGGGGGTSGTTLMLGPQTNLMFDFVYGQLQLEEMRFEGHQTGIFARVGRDFKDATRQEHGGNMILRQSVVRSCEWVRFNKVWEIKLAFDWAFYDCGFFQGIGTNPVAVDIMPSYEPSNNIMFYRCHWEEMRAGTFVKIHGTPGGGKAHNNFGFFGCHFEVRYYNTTIFDAFLANRISIYNAQISQNNTHGFPRGITEADMVPMFKLVNVSSFHMYDCATSRIDVVDSSKIASKIFELGGFATDVRVVGGILEPLTGTSLNLLWQHNATTPYTSNGDAPIHLDGVVPDPRQPLLRPDRDYVANPTSRIKRWGRRHTEQDVLEFGFTNSLEQNFSYTAPALSLLPSGKVRSRQDGGVSANIANNATQEFSFPNGGISAFQRGIYMLVCDFNTEAFAVFWSNGTAFTPIGVGSAVNLSAAEGSEANKLNVYYKPDGSGTIIVKNLLGSARLVEVKQFGI